MISSEVNCCCCACGCAQVRYLVDVWGADVHARGDEALRVASRCADAVAVAPGSNSGNNGNSSSCNGRCLVSMLPQAGGSTGGSGRVVVSDRGERCGSSSSSDGGGSGICGKASACGGEAVALVLLAHGADARAGGGEALRNAARAGRLVLASELIRRGAHAGGQRCLAFDAAVRAGHGLVAALLLAHAVAAAGVVRRRRLRDAPPLPSAPMLGSSA